VTAVLSAMFGWRGQARGIAWLVCIGIALAIALPLTIQYAVTERRAADQRSAEGEPDG
jgi:hypothetical protein